MRPTRRLASAWRISLWSLLIELEAVTLPALRRGLVQLLGLVRSPNDSFEVTPCEHAPFKPSLVLPLHVTLRRGYQDGNVTMIASDELAALRGRGEEVRTARRFRPRTPFERSALGAGRTHSSSEVLMVASQWSGGITADRRATRRGSRCPSSTWWTRMGLSQSSTTMIRRPRTDCEQAAGRVMAAVSQGVRLRWHTCDCKLRSNGPDSESGNEARLTHRIIRKGGLLVCRSLPGSRKPQPVGIGWHRDSEQKEATMSCTEPSKLDNQKNLPIDRETKSVRPTPQEGLRDGSFISLPPEAALDFGYRIPFVVTRRVYEAAIQWDKGGLMSESARASDVLWMALPAVRRAARTTTTPFPFQFRSTENRHANGTVNTSARSRITTLHAVVQPFGDGNLDCVTILMPDEV